MSERTCSVTGCSRGGQLRKGMCNGHYRRWHTTGDPGPVEIRDRNPSSYAAVHMRTRKVRGPASNYACQFCEAPAKEAKEWAYDGKDPNELVERVNGCDVTYSADLAHYIPLCLQCHRRFDGAGSKPLLDAADTAYCARRYEQGISSTVIAREVGCATSTVLATLRRAGVAIRPPLADRIQCCRGHRLVAPNLLPGRLPDRVCMACQRGRDAAHAAKRYHGEVWTEAQIQAKADEHYARIMAAA